jgi:hypothetical protein
VVHKDGCVFKCLLELMADFPETKKAASFDAAFLFEHA